MSWYWDGCTKKLFSGEYDDRLKEPKILKAKVEEHMEYYRVQRKDLDIVLEMTIADLLSEKPYEALWKSVVLVNPYESEENFFWVVPKADTGRRTGREIYLIVALKGMFPIFHTRLELVVCPLAGYVFADLMKLYQSDTEYKKHHNNDYKARKAEIAGSPWAEELDQHAYWERLHILD